MLETQEVTDAQLELMLQVEPEEALEWWAQLRTRQTEWREVESSAELVAVAQSISGDRDWVTVRTKGLDAIPSGRYAQAMNTGTGLPP
ncbi:hypothetical protein SAMN04487916_11496 [Arthrobacter sp. ov407]|uniref:hypothetical protein n=1 Tax=Arthrobacter sp. ov407 TaxID=1761748 RepID=UPI00088BF671|nr:hypothetical protein [Arthrobacter sp. ov407]SDL78738.1 hypothetical protein SAMN04487916_11496 [Arthrobacter sp. ov407]